MVAAEVCDKINSVGGVMADEKKKNQFGRGFEYTRSLESFYVSSSVHPDRKTRWFESTAYGIVVSLAIVELVHLVYTQLLAKFRF